MTMLKTPHVEPSHRLDSSYNHVCEYSIYHAFFCSVQFLLTGILPGFIHRSPVQGSHRTSHQTLRGACVTNIPNRRLTLAFLDTHNTHGSLLYPLRHLTLTPPNFLSYCYLPKCHCFCCITMGTAAVPSVPVLPLPITFSSPKFTAKISTFNLEI